VIEETRQLDKQITRDRPSRLIVMILSLILLPILGFLLGMGFMAILGFPLIIGKAAGAALGTYAAAWILPRSIINNGAVEAFITTNPVASFLNQDPLVFYGPGWHFCYWWEDREERNTVNLEEVTERFDGEVQTREGQVILTGAVRLRPDICHLHEFVSGAGSAAEDIKGLVVAHTLRFLGTDDASLIKILSSTGALNEELMRKFKHGDTQNDDISDFEERFGLIVGDVTVEKVLPSKQVQETMSAVTEARVIDEIVARSFGVKDVRALERKIKAGTITRKDVTLRRNQTLAMSGNLQGMKFDSTTTDFNLNIEGLKDMPPELVRAFGEAATVAGAARAGNKSKGNRS